MKKPNLMLLLVFLVLALIAGLLLFFYKTTIDSKTKDSQTTQPAQIDSQNQAVVFSLIEDKELPDSNKVERYALGAVEFKMYPFDEAGGKPGFFEVYQSGKKVFSSKPNYKVSGILSFKFGQNTYAIVRDYSGGAHCCETDYVFRINPEGQVKLIQTLEMGNATISKDNLLFKNNKLYIVLTDDRFQYFHVPYAMSYFFKQYWRLEGDTLVAANTDFNQEFIGIAEACEAKILTSSVQADDRDNYWLNNLVCYIANYSLVGKKEAALQKFNQYFNAFFPDGKGRDEFDQPLNRETLKQEIIEILNDERFTSSN